ncbi:metal-dependent hydrolase [Candidatus Woesearchaeota archaeon]|nr:metal-dependent hydrolase [Candidatus Woesearchaeota archaeon]
MNSHTHFLLPLLCALILFQFNLISWPLAILAGIIGILIDVDHYVEHILHAKTNRFSLRATWNNSIKLHRFQQRSFIHDGIGVVLLTVLMGISLFFNWQVVIVAAIGYYSHILLDYLHLNKERFLKSKILTFYLRESYFEITLDIIIILGIIIVLII